ncbi:MAG: Ppx/GppA phosphatase family protein [Syntrophorhabdaceae bacterium]|nr:Ppx/GppA phosphatase family protein [Syntrophorhabdaceae bacterium]
MKYAAIDIGTNTILLLVAEKHEGERTFRDIVDMSTVVRLGEGLVNSHNLSRAAMSRTVDGLRRYMDIAESHGVERLFCVGTAALREASNSGEFLTSVRDTFGFDVEIISARDEAYYTYLSVRDDDMVRNAGMTIIDIGGGSTEIISGTDKDFVGYTSLPMGSVRLTDAFVSHDPPLEEEMESVASYIKEKLSTVACTPGSVLLGTGGTVTNIAAMVAGIERYDKGIIHGLVMELRQLKKLMVSLAALTSDQRKLVKGMEPGREDIIVQGAVILKEIMEHGRFDRCKVSAAGVRYGVMYERCLVG